MKRRTSRLRGFSLLEVMVAIAILGLSLTVILSAQGGLAASNRSAANMGTAVELARCKMSETEESLLKLGYQLTDQIDLDKPCCLDTTGVNMTPDMFKCDTKVEHIEMPNQNGGNSLGDGGTLLGGASSAMLGPQNIAGGPGLNLDVDGGGMMGLQSFGSQLTNGAGADGLITMVLGMLYPSLKPMYEASIRRVTVTVKWKEGPVDRTLDLYQYVTNPQMGGFAGSALLADGGTMDFAPATTGTAKTTTPTTTGGTR